MAKNSKQVSTNPLEGLGWTGIRLEELSPGLVTEIRTGSIHPDLKELMDRPIHETDRDKKAAHWKDLQTARDLIKFIHREDACVTDRFIACLLLNLLDGEAACIPIRYNEVNRSMREYVEQTIMCIDRTT